MTPVAPKALDRYRVVGEVRFPGNSLPSVLGTAWRGRGSITLCAVSQSEKDRRREISRGHGI